MTYDLFDKVVRQYPIGKQELVTYHGSVVAGKVEEVQKSDEPGVAAVILVRVSKDHLRRITISTYAAASIPSNK